MKFPTVLKTLRKESRYTQEQLAEKLNISKSSISMYESGERVPTYETLEAIADIFNVDMNFLYGREHQESTISNLRPIKTKRFPMLGEIACGEPIFANEDHETYIDASADIKADFCLTAKGDSMIGARIHDGDVVFIRSQPVVDNGQIAAVIIGDEATLKRWYFYPNKKKLVLTPENPAYEPLVYMGDELDSVRCLGLAVAFMSNL